jgi:DNA-binding response OmpR family regulator
LENTLNAQVSRIPRILGIEDDADEIVILEKVLHQLWKDVAIDWARSAQEARRFLERGAYDVVLIDFALGGPVSGFDLWEEAYARKEEAPYVFITSLPYDRFLRMVGQERIAPPYLLKPIRPMAAAELIASVAEASLKSPREAAQGGTEDVLV